MATINSNGTGGGNWSSTSTWSGGVLPGTGDVATIVGSDNVVIDSNQSVGGITNTGNTSYISMTTGTWTLTVANTTGITYSGTNASGFIRVSGGTLTISGTACTTVVSGTSTGTAIVETSTGNVTINGPASASTYAVYENGGGYGLTASGSGTITINNSGGYASYVGNTGGAGVYIQGSAIGVIAGNASTNGAYGAALGFTSSSASSTFSGTVYCTGGSPNVGIKVTAGTVTWTPSTGVSATIGNTGALAAVYIQGGTLIVNGSLTTANSDTSAIATPILVSGGILQWTGSQTLAGASVCTIGMFAGTINLATASAAIALANSGTFVIFNSGGTLNCLNGSHQATITGQTTTSYQTITGSLATGTLANTLINYTGGGSSVGPRFQGIPFTGLVQP